MKDFSLEIFTLFLKTLKNSDYQFQEFQDFLVKPVEHSIALRHDVDLLPKNSLKSSKVEHSLDIKGTYYFRIIPGSFDKSIIMKIAELGHEIGYHYEDVSLVAARLKIKDKRLKNMTEEDLIDLAYESFCENLEKLRKIVPVNTICMHGSPLSPFDNKMIWKKYDYRKLGIIGEPYLDIDFNKVFYLTDTGRRWDGEEVSVRDKVLSKKEKGKSVFEDLRFRYTREIIKALEEGKLPAKIMITVHPQRWHDSFGPWVKELLWQNTKNIIKKYYFVKNNF